MKHQSFFVHRKRRDKTVYLSKDYGWTAHTKYAKRFTFAQARGFVINWLDQYDRQPWDSHICPAD